MSSFPARSVGVLFSPVGDRVVVYDLVTQMVHQLSATAGSVLAACDGVTSRADTIDEWSRATGTDPGVIADSVDAILREFTELGLTGRDEELVVPNPPTGSTDQLAVGAVVGRVHEVIDHRIVFRGADGDHAALIDLIDAFLGTDDPPTDSDSGELKRSVGDGSGGMDAANHSVDDRTTRHAAAVPLHLDVSEDPDTGGITVTSESVNHYVDREALLEGLPTLMNQYAVWSHGCITLHAGAVRSPDGEIVLLPAESGSGKSTLTAMLIRAGWDYLGDEAIGIRSGTLTAVGYPKPLSIKRGGRAVLGLHEDPRGGDSGRGVSSHVDPTVFRPDVARLTGDVGPVTRVVLPTHDPAFATDATELVPLESHEAVVELLANTFNLARIGQGGLDTLCDLAESVPVERLSFGSSEAAVAAHFSG